MSGNEPANDPANESGNESGAASGDAPRDESAETADETTPRRHVHGVAAALQPVVYGITATHFERPTPCEEFTVRQLLDHVLGTIEAMRRVGAKEDLDPNDPFGTNGGYLESETWQGDLGERLKRWADAWAQPDAWEGEPLDSGLDRATVGSMGLVEAMLHGWDLAVSTGQRVEYPDGAIAAASAFMDEMGEMGRTQGAFGPPQSAGEDASDLDRLVAEAGRDPEWSS